LKGVSEVNPSVSADVSLLNPPNKAACQAAGILKGEPGATSAARTPTHPKAPAGGLLSGLSSQAFGKAAAHASRRGG
jgi:hypothetical protein